MWQILKNSDGWEKLRGRGGFYGRAFGRLDAQEPLRAVQPMGTRGSHVGQTRPR
jgi:hypothetical protein